jgi:hypothetical protein
MIDIPAQTLAKGLCENVDMTSSVDGYVVLKAVLT